TSNSDQVSLNSELQSMVEELNDAKRKEEERSKQEHADKLAFLQEKQNLNDLLQSLVALMPEASAIVSTDKTILFRNSAYVDLLGDGAMQFVDGKNKALRGEAMPINRAANSEEFRQTYNVQVPDGTTRQLEFSARPLSSSDGVRGSLLTVREASA